MKTKFRYSDSLELDLQGYRADNSSVDVAMRSLESMTQTQDMANDNADSLDATSLGLIQQSVESFYAIANVGRTKQLFQPSNEAYSTSDLTQVTLEGIGEGIKNVYLSIINAIKSAFQWMWGLIKRIFGRNKDHEEKIEALEHQAEEVKKEGQEAETKKDSPYPRTNDGWMTKVVLKRPEIIRKICTPRGIMTKMELDKITGELARVFSHQSKNMQIAMQIKNEAKPASDAYEPPFDLCGKAEYLKQVGADRDSKVYVSHEFGNNEFVYIAAPLLRGDNGNANDVAKKNMKWADQLRIGKSSLPNAIDFQKFGTLEGDLANGDKLIETVKFLNKILVSKVDELKQFMSAKERFLNDFEAMVKKEGVTLFSSVEKKAKRNEMMYHLKLFKKTMDEPAMTYYGMCDGLIVGFSTLALHVLAFNRSNGNQVALSDDSKD